MFEWKNLWMAFERSLISQKIRSQPEELRKARLLLFVLLPSCLACIGLILAGFALKPEPLWGFWVILCGHLLVTCGIFILRFSSSSQPALHYIVTTATLQLLSATVASGGVESNVIYAYPVLPAFMATLVRIQVTLVACGGLMLGLLGIFLLDGSFPHLRELHYGLWIDYSTIFWGFCSVLAVAVYTRVKSDALVARVQEELQERVRAQSELEAVNEGKDRFLAYISHEIRNPLTTIVGASELLELQGKSPDSHRYLSAIKSSADSMRMLVDSVLDYSQAESGGVPLRLESLQVQPLLSELAAQFAGSAESKGIALYCEVAASAPVEVIADAQQLRQVLSNLVGNAIKFTPRGGEVHLSVDRVRTAWEGARISVRDNGIGIPLEEQERIFEPYQRHVGESPKQAGTGLGLAISHAILSNMGSELKVESQVGRGSQFFFELASSKSPLPALDASEQYFHEKLFLIAEDDASAAVVLAGMVTTLGGRIALARDGAEALRLFEQECPAGVLLDLRMPRINGIEVARAMRERLASATQEDAPCFIVGISGEAQRLSDSERGLFDVVLAKPIDLEQLLEAFRLPES